MATNTYVALKKTTLTGSAASVTLDLTGITGYTDLVLVSSILGQSGTSYIPKITVNTDSGTNYSNTWIYGTGSAAGSGRNTNATSIYLGQLNGYMTTGSPSTFITHLQNYSNTTTYKTVISRGSDAGASVDSTVGLWRSTSAITRIDLSLLSASNLQAGSTFSLYGIASAPAWAAKATGGTITYDVGYTYHTFTSSSTFTPSQALSCDVLTIAGGGGGGGENGGGGGAGGLVYLASQGLSSAQTVTVGAGGSGIGSGNGSQGSSSQVGSLTAAIGGGYGRGLTEGVGGNGGSGGGGSGNGTIGQSFAGGSGTSGQGNNGGLGGYRYLGGGGGGAGAVGGNRTEGNPGAGGNGGAGVNTYSSWASTTGTGSGGYYAGGGGGACASNGTQGTGGAGGGGTSAAGTNATSGTANTGSGGGGTYSAGTTSGSGGSGIVIIRYAN